METITSKEQRLAAASYLFTFYRDVMILLEHEAQYFNLILELEKTYGGEVSDAGIKEEDMQRVIPASQTVRFYARKCFMMYSTLKDSLDIKEPKGISKSFKSVMENYVIKSVDLQEYVIAINKVLVGSVIASLLDKSHIILDEIYGGDYAGAAEQQPTGE